MTPKREKWTFGLSFPGWFVSRRKRDELEARAQMTGKARESRSWLGGFIEIGVEAELVDAPNEQEKSTTTI